MRATNPEERASDVLQRPRAGRLRVFFGVAVLPVLVLTAATGGFLFLDAYILDKAAGAGRLIGANDRVVTLIGANRIDVRFNLPDARSSSSGRSAARLYGIPRESIVPPPGSRRFPAVLAFSPGWSGSRAACRCA